MHPLLADNLEAIHALCRQHGVLRLRAFGSVVDGSLREDSDVDLLVQLPRLESYSSFDHFFDLKEAFEKLLNRPVDLLIDKPFRNYVFAESLERNNVVVYEA